MSTSGGVWTAIDRAVAAGGNTLQIFSSSPRTWKAGAVKSADVEKLNALREEFDVHPLAIHASFLINLCSQTESIRASSTDAFRAEVQQALALDAEYLVVHPGSWKGLTRDEGLRLAAQSIERAIDGLPWQESKLKILIENAPGAEFSLGSTFEQVAEAGSPPPRLCPCRRLPRCLPCPRRGLRPGVAAGLRRNHEAHRGNGRLRRRPRLALQ